MPRELEALHTVVLGVARSPGVVMEDVHLVKHDVVAVQIRSGY